MHKIIQVKTILILLLTILAQSTVINAQHKLDTISFHPPVDIPMYLSGNFGEIRSTHFHTGIDIKTQGQIGFKIYSIDEGYISRIKIQAGGYGNAIYITHPNGYTSVYGHLDHFRKDIQEYTTNNQYRKNKFEINLFPPRDKFVLKKGEWFAKSGNSGRSGGPHLHFEIRDTESEHPLNPLLFNFDIKDDIKPKVYEVAIYPLNDDSRVNGAKDPSFIKVRGNNGRYKLANNDTIRAWGEIGFGISSNDFLNSSANKCGIYTIQLMIDSTLVFESNIDELDFSELRYVISHIDYKTKKEKGRTFQKSFIAPNNRLSIYKPLPSNMASTFTLDKQVSSVTYKLTDVYGNSSQLAFWMKAEKPTEEYAISAVKDYVQAMPYLQSNKFSNEQIELSFPAKCFFEDLFFNYSTSPKTDDLYSPIHHVHNIYTPLFKRYKLKIKVDSLPERLKVKAIVALVDTAKRKTNLVSMGGAFKNGYVETNIREFGSFAIAVDTVPPNITPQNIFNGKDMTSNSILSFKITDKLSGIESYEGAIDGVWVLFRYDAKRDHIYYQFSDNKITRNSKHQLNLKVLDHSGNEAIYTASFKY